jgi:hypothetical protein
MPNDFTNLMPPERQSTLTRAYYLRLSVIALWLVIFLAVVAMVLMVPTYVYLSGSARAKEERLATIEAKFSSTNEASLSSRISALSRSVTTLSALAKTQAASTVVRSVLELPRPGISITGFSYMPAAQKVAGAITVSGIAATRDSLRNYQLALQGAPFARAADLPVSAYAKDSEIPFAIIVTLKP